MASREEVQAALRDIARLADEHGRALHKAFRILADGALVGPHAVELEREMLVWHGAMRDALTGSFERVRELAASDPAGPPRVPAPYIGRPPVGAARAHSGAIGGDTGLLELLQGELGRAGRAWQDASAGVDRVLAQVGLDRFPARTLGEAGQWLTAQQSDLRRRQRALMRSDRTGLDIGPTVIGALLTALLAKNPELTAYLRSDGADPSTMPLGADPRSVAAWWQSLEARQRHAYTQALPSIVGWLDGLPATARNAANRLTLAARLNELESKPPARLTPFEHRDLSRLRSLRTRLDNLKAQDLDVYLLGLDSITPGLADGYGPKRNLLDDHPWLKPVHGMIADLTPGPDGRVIIAIGNPDNAHHTGIYVPGTTAQLDAIGGDLLRTEKLWTETVKHSAGESVSMITWLGYDAPDHIFSDSPIGAYADVGGPQFDRFVDGVRAAQGDAHRHLTAIGHSYGSTVLGEGARIGNGLNVDDIVVAGSPGMRVGHAGDLHMAPGRVWAAAAPDDPVPLVGRLGHGGGIKFVPMVPLIVPKVPSDRQFGGRRLFTDTHGHSGYWDGGSKSLQNQAKVVAGLHLNQDPADNPKIRY